MIMCLDQHLTRQTVIHEKVLHIRRAALFAAVFIVGLAELKQIHAGSRSPTVVS